MNLMRAACITGLAFSLFSCQKPIEMTSDLNAGEYQIGYIDIQPANSELKDEPEYWTMKKHIIAKLKEELPKHGRPPIVGLKITVNKVNISLNAVQTVLIGDSYHLYSTVQLWDVKNKRQLGKAEVAAQLAAAGGIGGLIGQGIGNSLVDSEDTLATQYVNNLIQQLYPKKD